MKFVKVVRLETEDHEYKYFLNVSEARFYAQCRHATPHPYKLELVDAFYDDSSYFIADKIIEDCISEEKPFEPKVVITTEIGEGIAKSLKKDQFYTLCWKKSQWIGPGRDETKWQLVFNIPQGYNIGVTYHRSRFSSTDNNSIEETTYYTEIVGKGARNTIYRKKDPINVEDYKSKYTRIAPTMDDVLSRAIESPPSAHQQGPTFFSQKQQDALLMVEAKNEAVHQTQQIAFDGAEQDWSLMY